MDYLAGQKNPQSFQQVGGFSLAKQMGKKAVSLPVGGITPDPTNRKGP